MSDQLVPSNILNSEVSFWNDCGFKWRPVSHGPQVHGVLPGADKPGNDVLLQPHNRHWFLFLLGHQRVWKTCFCCGWTSQEEEEEVESIWCQKESKKAPRIPEKEVWRKERWKLCCVANSWEGACSTSGCWSSAHTCESTEGWRGRNAILFAITHSYLASGLWSGQVWQHVGERLWTNIQQWRWIKSPCSFWWPFHLHSWKIFNTLSMGRMHISWRIVSCRWELLIRY